MEMLHQRLGPHALVGDLVELGIDDTPQYDPYEDESQNTENSPVCMKNQRKPQSGGTNM